MDVSASPEDKPCVASHGEPAGQGSAKRRGHSQQSEERRSQRPLHITTLKTRADFLRLRRGGKHMAPYFILRYAPIPAEAGVAAGASRVGYTVTTQCGNAVLRNRIKRRLRALVRELFPASAKPGHDYVLIALDKATPSAADAPYADLRAAMQRALTRIHP